jgi:DNA polymerase (family 10)
MLAINTDAHRPADLDLLHYGVLTARRAWAQADHVINCFTRQKLESWLKRKR